MPDAQGNPTPIELTQALQQFSAGPIGLSPATIAATEAFRAQTLPVIQQQFALQGLRGSPGLGLEAGRQLGSTLVPLITQDMVNRLQAIQMMQGQTQEARRQSLQEFVQPGQLQLGALGTAGQLALGLGQPLAQSGQLEQARQQMTLQALGSGGQAQQDVAQRALDAQQMEMLRRQSLAEQGSFGIFGGSVVPPTLQASSRTKTSGGK